MRTTMLILPLIFASAILTACGGASGPGESAPPANVPEAAPAPPPAAPPSGPLYGAPMPPNEKLNDIDDLSRDLRNIGQGEPNASADFMSDLQNIVSEPPEKAPVDAFGRSIATALEGHALDLPKARRVAELLYAGLHTNLSQNDRAGIRKELSALLAEGGVPADRLTAVEQAFDRLGGTPAK
jgi:hypothetical protein